MILASWCPKSLYIGRLKLNELLRWFCLLCLGIAGAGPKACGQNGPSLKFQLSAGHPTFTLKGDAGTVYSIQYADRLLPTNSWIDRTLVQVQGSSIGWSDPAVITNGQRYYRAVTIAPPADTNLVFIPPGTFVMGSPANEALRFLDETPHIVTLSRGFWISQYLMTQKDYIAVVGSNPSQFQGNLERPVERVSWYNATNYCYLRTQQEQAAGLIPSNYVYRLPTESEWEYACRAGTTTAFYLGNSLSSGQANFDGQYGYDASSGQSYNPAGLFLQQTTPVGSYTTNAWGLYDMIGNVMEWCQDLYGAYPTGSVVDPQGASTGTTRVRRGGYWQLTGQYCRSAQRGNGVGTVTLSYYGFRIVLAPDPS